MSVYAITEADEGNPGRPCPGCRTYYGAHQDWCADNTITVTTEGTDG